MRLTVFSFLSLCSFIWARDEQPNILYIFTDDQSVRSVSAYEKARSWVSTPNIDRLAKSGVRFTQCYTGTWCQPSRASALTGLLQHRLDSIKVTKYPMASYDPKKLPFFPSVLRKTDMKPPVLESGTSVKMWGMAGTGITRLSGTVARPTEEKTANGLLPRHPSADQWRPKRSSGRIQ